MSTNIDVNDVSHVLGELGAEVDHKNGNRVDVSFKGHKAAFHRNSHSLAKAEVLSSANSWKPAASRRKPIRSDRTGREAPKLYEISTGLGETLQPRCFGAYSALSTRMARKSLTLVSVGPVTTLSPRASKKP